MSAFFVDYSGIKVGCTIILGYGVGDILFWQSCSQSKLGVKADHLHLGMHGLNLPLPYSPLHPRAWDSEYMAPLVTVNCCRKTMLTCVFSLLSVHSCSSMGPPILHNVVSDLGSKTEEEGLFYSIFLYLDTIVSAMSSVNIKNIFFFPLRKLSRTRESLISSIRWKPRLCLKEPSTFLGDGPG